MSSPIHDCLDGERPREELSVEERDELAALEAAIALAVEPLRAAPVPDLSARVMARLADLGEAPALEAAQALQAAPAQRADPILALRRALAWLWAPRRLTIRVRPAFAMLIPALAVAVLGVVFSSSGPHAPLGAPPQVYVQFRLETEGASRVELAGSFTGWRPEVELRESAPGVWSILFPLRPGIHDYAFVVDGERWVADPHALHVDDGFGGSNSRIALPAPVAGGTRI